MTIGIAAFGPRAGLAIVEALRAVEAVGHGAIGGFVSLVVVTEAGTIARADTQRGGIAAVFRDGAIPDAIGAARRAGLMASGPDRPEPLSQFTPADPAVGLVSGHRFPNTIGVGGRNLSSEVLDLMRRGLTPRSALSRVVAANPGADAGMIALSVDGRIASANTAHVERRGDAGAARRGSTRQGAVVAVLHNAIRPRRSLAALAAEVAMDVMCPDDEPDGWITFRRGAQLLHGPRTAVVVDAGGTVDRIYLEDPKFLTGRWSLGIGHQVPVVRNETTPVGEILYEPYMVVESGALLSLDGQDSLSVPVRRIAVVRSLRKIS